MNIRTYSEEKLMEIISMHNPDILFLQETRLKAISQISGYKFFYSYLAYAGVLTVIKEEIMDQISEIKALLQGRLMLVKLKNKKNIFNVYHKRVSNKNDLEPRIEYDKSFLTCVNDYIDDENIFVGDFNSVHKLHDSVKNLSIQDDKSRKCPENWVPGNNLDKNFGCYERHFISSFITKYNLIDNGEGKGFTFKKFNKDCMRIDFLLSPKNIDSYKIIDFGELSDHKAISFEI